MAYEFGNGNESPGWKVVDLFGRFFFTPEVQNATARTVSPIGQIDGGVFQGHHLIPTGVFSDETSDMKR